MRLIDADALPTLATELRLKNGKTKHFVGVEFDDIKNAPTIEVEPVNLEAIKAKEFAYELIGYIFAYPDDDYMLMETLCRKLYKHGLIDKKDGEWTCNFIEPADTPQTENPCDGCVCDDGKHLMYCMNCKGIAWQTEPPKVTDTPQTERKDK